MHPSTNRLHCSIAGPTTEVTANDPRANKVNQPVFEQLFCRRRFVQSVTLVLMAASCASCAPRIRTLRHDPTIAAREAQAFVEAAFVEQNFKHARTYMSAEMRKHPLSEIEASAGKIHPKGHPTTVSATEFEPIPGQAAMNIFLVGDAESEKFYYRVVMAGTADEGYTVAGFWRGSGPHPPSKLRQTLPR